MKCNQSLSRLKSLVQPLQMLRIYDICSVNCLLLVIVIETVIDEMRVCWYAIAIRLQTL